MNPIMKKLDKPVLTRFDVPYPAALVFNAGVTKYNGKYVMLFRNDYGDPAQAEHYRLHQDHYHRCYLYRNGCRQVHLENNHLRLLQL